MSTETSIGGAPLTNDERAELERLRAEVAELRSPTPGAPAPPGRTRHFWRWTAVVLLLVLTGLLALGSVTTRFVRSQLLDTDRYVSTVAPLASDPAVQSQVVDAITNEIDSRVDIEGLTAQALTTLTELTPPDRPRLDTAVVGLAPVIAGQAQTFIRQTVTQLVASQQFEDLWIAANRAAHDAVVAAVTGETQRAGVQVSDNGSISIALGPIITQVKQRLADRGFSFADKIPAIDKQFVIFQSADLAKVQRLVNALDKIATALPWITIAAAAAAVAIAPSGRRMRTLMLVGVAWVVSMLVLAIGILIGRAIYLDQIPPDVLSADAASAVFDTVITPLRTALRAVAVLGVIVAIVGFLTGGSRSAAYVRGGVGRSFDALQNRRKNRPPTAAETWAWHARVPLRTAVVAIAAVLLMFWRYPTGQVVIWTVIIAVLVLVILEVLIRPGRPQTEPAPIEADATPAG